MKRAELRKLAEAKKKAEKRQRRRESRKALLPLEKVESSKKGQALPLQTTSKKSKTKLYFGLCCLLAVILVLEFYLMRPHLKLLGQKELTLTVNSDFQDPGAVVSFLGSEIDSRDIEVDGQVDTHVPGAYPLVYTYAFLGVHEEVQRTISVVDKEPPTLTLNGEEQLVLEQGTPYEELGASAEDDSDMEIQNKIEISGEVHIDVPGEYVVTYHVKDRSGNQTQVTRKITVTEKSVPVDEKSIIYLTFDDGPDATVTPQILQTLATEGVEATFFVTGFGPDDLITQAFNAGHGIGLHTFTHDYASVYKSVESYYQDLQKVDERVSRLTGEKSRLVRFPGGSSNGISANYCPGIMTTLTQQLVDNGYQYYDWNVSSGDGANQPSSDVPYENVISQLQKDRENIVLMHDTKQTSADAVKRIIQYGKEQGFVFRKLTPDIGGAHHGVTN